MIRRIQNRPVTSFLFITLAVSYGVGIPFNIAAATVFDSSSLAGIYVPRLATVIGPAVAAWTVARWGCGVIRVPRLFGSLLLRPGDVPWIAAAAGCGLAIGGAGFVLAGLEPHRVFELVTTRAAWLVAHVLIQVTVIGVGEELGWRGWLLPTLSAGRSFGAATALTGLAWALWHLPILLSAPSIAFSFASLVASLSIVFSWLWHRTGGGVGLIALAHGLVNGPFFFLEQMVRPMPEGAALTARAFAYFAACYAAIAIVLVLVDRRIWRDRDALSRFRRTNGAAPVSTEHLHF